ncbi:hypothetical protein, partial [Prevotella pallens]|uniref:hypothetical protein n=1 Tax=Prevotella pallens TaxID=60133 RepID=UPI00288A6255
QTTRSCQICIKLIPPTSKYIYLIIQGYGHNESAPTPCGMFTTCFVVECGHFAECSWDISWTNVALLANHNAENN